MKILFRLVAALVFVLFFVFALKNTHPAELLLFNRYYIEAPLVLMLLGFLVVGAALGILAITPTLFRYRRELARQKKIVTTLRHEHEAMLARPTRPPQPDMLPAVTTSSHA
jgi:putative membrane protein